MLDNVRTGSTRGDTQGRVYGTLAMYLVLDLYYNLKRAPNRGVKPRFIPFGLTLRFCLILGLSLAP